MENLQRQINLAEHGKPILCEKCGSRFFRDVVYVFKVSKIIAGTTDDAYVPIKTLACDECGHVNAEFDMKNDMTLASSETEGILNTNPE